MTLHAGLANKVTEGIGSEAKKLTNLTASEVGMQGLIRHLMLGMWISVVCEELALIKRT